MTRASLLIWPPGWARRSAAPGELPGADRVAGHRLAVAAVWVIV